MLRPLTDAPAGSLAARSVAKRPALLTMFEAPYLHAHWPAGARVTALRCHLDTAETIPLLNFEVDSYADLIDLAELGADCHLVIDKPPWLMREGVATLNLFQQEVRLFSLSFALERRDDALVAIIGGIQGRKLPEIIDIYRDLTRQAHGMRPADFMVETFRLLAAALGVERIEAISTTCRQNRSAYHGPQGDRQAQIDYDRLWLERGGVAMDEAFWNVPVVRPERTDIPARKRAIYRARYAMLDSIGVRIVAAVALFASLGDAVPL